MLVILIAVHIVLLLGALALREWRLMRRRQREAQAFSERTDGPRLRAMVQDIAGVLGPNVLDLPEILVPSPLTGDQQRDAEAAVAFAATRFDFSETLVVHVGLPRDHSHLLGAAMLPQRPWSAEVTPEKMTFVVGPKVAQPREIFIAPAILTDPMRTHVVATHEVAHHVLHSRGVAGSGRREEEERVEVAMVLAGLFPLMHQLRYVEQRWIAEGPAVGGSVELFGTLSKGALEFVRGLRQEGGV